MYIEERREKYKVWIDNTCEWKTIWAKLLFSIEEY